MKRIIKLAKETYGKWSEHQAPRLGASVAFYSVLSFAPLLVLITAVIALVFGQASAQGELIHVARQWIGDKGAETVESLLKNAQKPSSGIFSTIVAFTTLLFGASGVFTELHDALNVIWEVQPKTGGGVVSLIKDKLFSFGMVLSVGFLLLISLVLSAGLAYVGGYFGELLPMPPPVLQALNFLVSFAVVAVLFGLMFKYVPNATVAWRDVLVGAVGTALLFTIGKFLLGMYLGRASVGSPYGAAGSLVAVVVWIYYSAQIFFFGAEFTHAYAESGVLKVEKKSESVNASARLEADAAVDKPRAAAAAAGSSSPSGAPLASGLVPTVSGSLEVKAVHAIRQDIDHLQEEKKVSSKPPEVIATVRKPKPQLLMAVGLGFIAGRVFNSVASRKAGARPGRQ